MHLFTRVLLFQVAHHRSDSIEVVADLLARLMGIPRLRRERPGHRPRGGVGVWSWVGTFSTRCLTLSDSPRDAASRGRNRHGVGSAVRCARGSQSLCIASRGVGAFIVGPLQRAREYGHEDDPIQITVNLLTSCSRAARWRG